MQRDFHHNHCTALQQNIVQIHVELDVSEENQSYENLLRCMFNSNSVLVQHYLTDFKCMGKRQSFISVLQISNINVIAH